MSEERKEQILQAKKCPICKKLILRGPVLMSKGFSYHLDCFAPIKKEIIQYESV
ncbi:unnamed protein product [marine sediment metagenome]|uniref:LIM zinc-binding domain-containing protein n=1 Tax=marine sediment metagenome TaxID=412755 RepID=X0UBC5_9ZZZZ